MVPESWVEFVLSLHTTLISFISTITCANLLQLFSLLLSTLYVFPSYTTYFRCRLAPHPFFPKKIPDARIFSHFYSTFIISSIYHQELIFELTFCARSQVSRSRLLLPRRSLFVYTELCWRKKEEFMSRLQSYRLCFLVNVFLCLSLFVLRSEYFSVERREQFISMLDASPFYTIFTKARACILICFLFFVLNFVFLDNYFSNVRCNICCQKFFQRRDKILIWDQVKNTQSEGEIKGGQLSDRFMDHFVERRQNVNSWL